MVEGKPSIRFIYPETLPRPPGYTQVRYTVTVVSPAAEEEVRRMIDTADRYSPYRDVFARAHDVRREVRLTQPQG